MDVNRTCAVCGVPRWLHRVALKTAGKHAAAHLFHEGVKGEDEDHGVGAIGGHGGWLEEADAPLWIAEGAGDEE